MVSAEEALPISRQCELLDIPRSSFYYMPEPVTDDELALMRLIDQCYLERPYYRTRRIKDWLLDNHGLVVNRKRIQRLRRLLAIETLYPKRNLSLASQRHKILYPDGQRIRISGRCDGLVLASSTLMACVDNDGYQLLR